MNVLSLMGFFNIMSFAAHLTTRPALISVAMTAGDGVATGKTLALMKAWGSFLQLAVAPNIGRLSDSFGRKPVAIGMQLGAMLPRLWLCLQPYSPLALWVEFIVPQGVSYFTVTALAMASCSDMADRAKDVAALYGKIFGRSAGLDRSDCF